MTVPEPACRYVVDEIIPEFGEDFPPDGYVVLDMEREREVAAFLNACPDARKRAQSLADDLNDRVVAS